MLDCLEITESLNTHFRITPGLPVLPPSLANNHVGGGVDDMGNGGSALTGNGTGWVNIAIFPWFHKRSLPFVYPRQNLPSTLDCEMYQPIALSTLGLFISIQCPKSEACGLFSTICDFEGK